MPHSSIGAMMAQEGMTLELEAGIRSFILECTPSYNISSKRYSVWTLIRKHIDAPVARYLKKENMCYLFDSTFSIWLRNRKMAVMHSQLKSHITNNKKNPELTANLESLIEVSYFVLARHASKKVETSGLKGSRQINYGRKVDHRHYPYCELCWRLSQAAVRDVEHPEKTSASQRFCEEHNPSVPGTKYRTDLRFKDRFDQELLKLRTSRSTFNHSYTEIREIAYINSHRRKNSLRIAILELYQTGASQSEIAKQLGISRQAVSKSLS